MNKKGQNLFDRILFIGARLVLVAVVVTALAQLVFVNSLATSGKTFSELDEGYKTLLLENEKLRKEKSELMSLSSVATRSAQLGFVSSHEYHYIPSFLPLAMGFQE